MIMQKKNNLGAEDIEEAKASLVAAKARLKVIQSSDGETIDDVPPVPQNLTYSLYIIFKIKNHSNAYDPYCIFYRGYDIENGSPTLFFNPRDSSLKLIFRDLNSENMIIKTDSIPLQRWNKLGISIENRKIKIILNDYLFKVSILKNIPYLCSTSIKLLPGNSSQHVQVSFLRYYNHSLKLRNVSSQKDHPFYLKIIPNKLLYNIQDITENFETKKEDNIIRPNNNYDNFYSKVYTELIKKNVIDRAKFEVEDLISRTNMKNFNKIDLLDIGTGGGNHLEMISKKSFPNISIIGIDKSPHMLHELEKNIKSIKTISLIQGNVTNPDLFPPLSFSHITCFYFTVYNIHFDLLAKNVRKWLIPGGWFVVHFVDPKHFDPMLDAANPYAGISLQKYSNKRLTESKIEFEKFSYYSNFTLNKDTSAYFDEEFHFKTNNKIRKQRHSLIMPHLDIMKKYFEKRGLDHKFTTDLSQKGFNYQYLYYFQKGSVPEI